MANFPLQLILPRASNSTPDVGHTAISANHRIFWAYPSIEYSIRAYVIGGTWPYTFQLSGHPTGMTVDSNGVITWTATGNGTSSGTITLTVTDAENTSVQESWSISVDSSRFTFFDSEAVTDGTGTFASPYNTVSHIANGDVPNTDICYFRGRATPYYFNEIAPNNVGSYGLFRYITFRSDLRSTQWLAYPGDSKPIIDLRKALEYVPTADVDATNDWFVTGRFGDIWATGDPVRLTSTVSNTSTAGTLPAPLATGTTYYVIRVDSTHVRFATSLANAQSNTYIDITDQGSANSYHTFGNPFIRFQQGEVYFEGFTVQNVPNKAVNLVNDCQWAVIRNCGFSTGYGGGNGQNSGFIMTEGNDLTGSEPVIEYFAIQDCTFDNYIDGCGVKIYSTNKLLFENNTITNIVNGTSGKINAGVSEGLALKGGFLTRPTVRWNVLHDIDNEALNGNQNIMSDAEYYHNLAYNCTTKGVYFNNFTRIRTDIYIYRNTFLCDVWVNDGLETGYYPGLTDADAGPFRFTNNVIINNDYTGTALSSITYDSTKRGGTIIMTDNLQGVAADNITNSTGALQGTYRDTYLGLRGYEVGTPNLYNRRVRRGRVI